jgi:hypothetical protein
VTRDIEPRQEVVDQIHAEVFADKIARAIQAQAHNDTTHPERLNLSDAEIIDHILRGKTPANSSAYITAATSATTAATRAQQTRD